MSNWIGRTKPTSNWIGRTKPTSNWTNTRLGGAYLLDNLGNYILTNNNEKIIVIVKGGKLPITNWIPRIQPN